MKRGRITRILPAFAIFLVLAIALIGAVLQTAGGTITGLNIGTFAICIGILVIGILPRKKP